MGEVEGAFDVEGIEHFVEGGFDVGVHEVVCGGDLDGGGLGVDLHTFRVSIFGGEFWGF